MADTIFIWVQWDRQGDWEPHASFAADDDNAGTTVATDWQAEIADLKDDGHNAKKGGPF